ncbi:hypothetical protein J6590_090223 [Homalodisca vitripennis]|nr:hypothetical protein J6590_090223 [Homalodisca vitripennis]
MGQNLASRRDVVLNDRRCQQLLSHHRDVMNVKNLRPISSNLKPKLGLENIDDDSEAATRSLVSVHYQSLQADGRSSWTPKLVAVTPIVIFIISN